MRHSRSFGAVRATTAGFLSALVPGTGQALLGSWAHAVAFLGGSVLLALAGLWLAGEPARLIELVSHRDFLLWLLVANLVILLFRGLAVWDAFSAAGRWRRSTRLAAALLMIGVVAAPHAAVAYYGTVLDRTLDAVLVPSQPAPPTTVPAPPPTTAPPSAPPTTEAPSTTLPPAPPTTEPARGPWDELDRLNVLLVGTDAGPGRSGARTDSMVVASIDMATGRVGLFSLPRNMIHTPLPEPLASRFECGCWEGLLNALYKYGEENPGLFPGAERPGVEALRGAVSELLAIPIHHYVMVDMGGFVDVVDAFGGVTIDVRDQVVVELSPPRPGDPWRTYRIMPGLQTLDGHHALAYARSREGGSDYDRMYRQRCLLSAMATQAAGGNLLMRLPDLARVAAERVVSDLPRDSLPDLARLAGRIDTSTIVTIGFVPPAYSAWRDSSGRPAPDVELIRKVVADVFDAPPVTAGPDIAGGGCGQN